MGTEQKHATRHPVLLAIVFIAALAFFLNLIWENAQAPLYAGYGSFLQHFLACLRAVAGDVIITLLLFGAAALVNNGTRWMRQWSLPTAALIGAAGALIAVLIELHALRTGRWSYTTSMPLIPLLNVGLLPVLQLALLPLATFYITSRIIRVGAKAGAAALLAPPRSFAEGTRQPLGNAHISEMPEIADFCHEARRRSAKLRSGLRGSAAARKGFRTNQRMTHTQENPNQ